MRARRRDSWYSADHSMRKGVTRWNPLVIHFNLHGLTSLRSSLEIYYYLIKKLFTVHSKKFIQSNLVCKIYKELDSFSPFLFYRLVTTIIWIKVEDMYVKEN